MAKTFPEKLYGQCAVCNKAKAADPTGAYTTSDVTSEDVPLVWSDAWQALVCQLHLRNGPDLIKDEIRSANDREAQVQRRQMGFSTTYENAED